MSCACPYVCFLLGRRFFRGNSKLGIVNKLQQYFFDLGLQVFCLARLVQTITELYFIVEPTHSGVSGILSFARTENLNAARDTISLSRDIRYFGIDNHKRLIAEVSGGIVLLTSVGLLHESPKTFYIFPGIKSS